MDEICQNCGGPKFTHPEIANFIGQPFSEEIYDSMLQEIIRCKTLYGNVCLNYKRDNLKYLEECVSMRDLT